MPSRPEWLHKVKHDGYRLLVQRDGKRVRLFTRNGYDWSDRYSSESYAGGRAATNKALREHVTELRKLRGDVDEEPRRRERDVDVMARALEQL